MARLPQSPRRQGRRRGRILVIEDEATVAHSMARLLRTEHDVVVELDPHAALSRLASDEHFDIIFCNLQMPRFSGIDLYKALASTRPELAKRLVFVTGGALSRESEQFLNTVANPSLSKPFMGSSLQALARDYASSRVRPSDIPPQHAS